MTGVHVVLPGDIDDPLRPSGGNAYDRHICHGLTAAGWTVREHPVPGTWPRPDGAARSHLANVLGGLPDGALVIVDGLVASAAATQIMPAADRLRLVVLMHMPLGDDSPAARTAERAVLGAATAVVTTSQWTRRRLDALYALPGDRVHVVEPGIEPAGVAPGTPTGAELLCVAAVTPGKGHDVLFEALPEVEDRSWHLTCAGSLDLRAGFVAELRDRADALGVADRITFTGPLTGDDLSAAYAAADLLVLPSRAETYGMVVAEALARGLPVVASRVGGVPEALGHSRDGALPGALIPSGDPQPLAHALRRWLTDAGHRDRLRHAARSRRLTLTRWSRSTARMAHLLATMDDEPGSAGGRRSR